MIKLKGKMPILACAWDISICEAFGGTIAHAKKLMHGKQSDIRLDSHIKEEKSGLPEKMGCGCRLFEGLPSVIPAARYHSLSAVLRACPRNWKWWPWTVWRRGHGSFAQDYPIYGLQFHPESILTPDGRKILENFLNIGTIQAM